MSAFEARGTRRPHARTPYPKGRGSGGSDMGDSLGPGDGLLAGCSRFFRAVFWVVVVVALCVVIGLVL